MARQRAYVETSIISYLTARPSRDVVVAGRQQLTREWWEQRRGRFELYVFEVVIEEISAGDARAAEERLAIITGLPSLDVTEEADALAMVLVDAKIVPPRATQDAFHLAVAAVHGMDLLLTWICRHLANARILKRAYHLLSGRGYEPPTICTPDELEGSEHGL